MKKLLIPICAMLLCMAACQKENDNVLVLEAEQYSNDAKLHLDGNSSSNTRYSVWDNGDEIQLNGERRTVSVSGNKATISAADVSAPYTAIFPFEWTSANTITYPPIQEYNGNVIKAPMAGYCDENSTTLKFHNLGSILVVNVENTTGGTIHVRNIAVSADNSVMLNGTATITNLASGTPSLSELRDGTNTVTLNCGDVVLENNATQSFYIALPPVSDAKLTIKVYDDRYCYSKTQSTTHSMVQNHGYNASFSMNGDGVSRCEFIKCSVTNNLPIDLGENPFGEGVTYSQIYDQVNNMWIIDCNQPITQIGGAFDEKIRSTTPEEHPITSITLPNTVITIKTDAFHFLTRLKSLVLSSSLTTIESYGISECISLETLVLPSSVTSIDAAAIFNPHGLRELIVEATTPPAFTMGMGFSEIIGYDEEWGITPADLTIYVPHESVANYQTAAGWSRFASNIKSIRERPQQQ